MLTAKLPAFKVINQIAVQAINFVWTCENHYANKIEIHYRVSVEDMKIISIKNFPFLKYYILVFQEDDKILF